MKLFSARRERGEEAEEPAGDQIASVSEANRRSRNVANERRLLRLRHEAFAGLPKGDPAPIPDPDPTAIESVDGLPAARPGRFGAGAVSAGLQEGGCLLVRGLVDEQRITELVASIDRAFDARDSAEGESEDGWFEPLALGGGAYNLERQRQWVTSAGGVWTADSPRITFALIDLFREIGLLDVAEDYLGERPSASVNKWTLRRVSPGGDADWHQDGAFLGEDIRALNVWLALTDCGVDAPGMDVIPRRLDGIVETGTEGARFDWSVSPQEGR